MKQKADGDWKHEKAVIFDSIREIPWSLVRVAAYHSKTSMAILCSDLQTLALSLQDDGSGVRVEIQNGKSAHSLVRESCFSGMSWTLHPASNAKLHMP